MRLNRIGVRAISCESTCMQLNTAGTSSAPSGVIQRPDAVGPLPNSCENSDAVCDVYQVGQDRRSHSNHLRITTPLLGNLSSMSHGTSTRDPPLRDHVRNAALTMTRVACGPHHSRTHGHARIAAQP